MKISVIVPVYNAEKYLKKCIDSILSQTFNDIEVILINDGSTDNSYNICQEYLLKDSRIVLINQSNKGVARTRNVGLDNAKGEYIAWVDSDDWIEDTYIQQMYDFSMENGEIPVFALRNIKSNKTLLKNDEVINAFLDGIIESNLWSTLFKKDYYDGLRFMNYPIGEDSIMIVNLISRTRSVCCLHINGYHYVDNCDSLTRNMSQEKLKAWMSEVLTQRDIVEKNFPCATSKMNYKVMMFMADLIHETQENEIKNDAIVCYKEAINKIRIFKLSKHQAKMYILKRIEIQRLLKK